jgi:hypothetical protein
MFPPFFNTCGSIGASSDDLEVGGIYVTSPVLFLGLSLPQSL